MKRNLSTSWYTSIPDIDMSGRLKKIELLLSHEDYTTALNVLQENLGETFDDPHTRKTAAQMKSQSSDVIQKTSKLQLEMIC